MVMPSWILLRVRNISDKSIIKTHFILNIFFLPKIVPLRDGGFLTWKSCLWWRNVEKYCRVKQAIQDSIVRCMRFACWITKATNTYLLLLHDNNDYANALQCYVYNYVTCHVNTTIRDHEQQVYKAPNTPSVSLTGWTRVLNQGFSLSIW